jgi:hypothetical protein
LRLPSVVPFRFWSVLLWRLQRLEAIPLLLFDLNGTAARDFLDRRGSGNDGASDQKQDGCADSNAHSGGEGRSAPTADMIESCKIMFACSITRHGTLSRSLSRDHSGPGEGWDQAPGLPEGLAWGTPGAKFWRSPAFK